MLMRGLRGGRMDARWDGKAGTFRLPKPDVMMSAGITGIIITNTNGTTITATGIAITTATKTNPPPRHGDAE